MGDRSGGETSGTLHTIGQSSGDYTEHRKAYNYGPIHSLSETDAAQVHQSAGGREGHWYGYPPVNIHSGPIGKQPYSSSTFSPPEITHSYQEISQLEANNRTDAGTYHVFDEGDTSLSLIQDTSSMSGFQMNSSDQSMSASGSAVNFGSTRFGHFRDPTKPVTSLLSPQPRPIERSDSLLASNFDTGGTFHQSLHNTSSEPHQPSWIEHGTEKSIPSPLKFTDISQSQASGYGAGAPLSASSTASFSFHETPYPQEKAPHSQQHSSLRPSLQHRGAVMPYLHSHVHSNGLSQSTASLSNPAPLHSPFATHFSQAFGQSTGNPPGPHTYPNSQHYPQQGSEYQSNGYQSLYMQDYHPRTSASVSSYHLPLRTPQSQGLHGSGSSYYQGYGSSSATSQSDPYQSGSHLSIPVHNEAAQGLESAIGNPVTSAYTQLQYDHPNTAAATSEMQTGVSSSQASRSQYLQPHSHHDSLTPTSVQSEPFRYYQNVNVPSYKIRQYPNQHLSLAGTSHAASLPQPSPTWSASPIVSPALMAYPPGLYKSISPGTDYFATSDSRPSPVDHFKDQQTVQEQLNYTPSPSSPPTSNSPGSQQSGQACDDISRRASLLDQGTSSMNDSDLYAKEGRPAPRSPAAKKARGSVKAGKVSGTAQPPTKKETRVVEGTCKTCSKVFATINIRGQPEDFANEFDLVYYCLDCAPAILGVSRSEMEASLGLNTGISEESRANSQAVTPSPSTTTFEAASVLADPVKLAPRGARKRIRATDVSSPTVCDVCSRWVAHGAPVARAAGAELGFNVEIVCALCCDKYRRCSDCGGGGGARLGVGKWRCKELFAAGRKTCNMSHARQSSIQTMEYFITRISDIPDEEMPELLDKCQVVFRNALLNGLAVPEVLERGAAMAGTYADVTAKIVDGWAEAKKIIEEDVEASDRYRRYIGLRWSATISRRVVSRKKGGRGAASADAPAVVPAAIPNQPRSTKVLRANMHLSGYVSGEWDIHGGTIYITVSVPYSTGDQYEGSAHIISLLQRRIVQERQEMIDELIQQGRHAEAMSIPVILHAFTMLFYSPDSKLMAYMESKRAMIPLQRYMDKYKDTDPHVFPPYRKTYIAPTQKPEEWTVLVRRVLYPSQVPVPSSPRRGPMSEPSSSNHNSSYADETTHQFDQTHQQYDTSIV